MIRRLSLLLLFLLFVSSLPFITEVHAAPLLTIVGGQEQAYQNCITPSNQTSSCAYTVNLGAVSNVELILAVMTKSQVATPNLDISDTYGLTWTLRQSSMFSIAPNNFWDTEYVAFKGFTTTSDTITAAIHSGGCTNGCIEAMNVKAFANFGQFNHLLPQIQNNLTVAVGDGEMLWIEHSWGISNTPVTSGETTSNWAAACPLGQRNPCVFWRYNSGLVGGSDDLSTAARIFLAGTNFPPPNNINECLCFQSGTPGVTSVYILGDVLDPITGIRGTTTNAAATLATFLVVVMIFDALAVVEKIIPLHLAVKIAIVLSVAIAIVMIFALTYPV